MFKRFITKLQEHRQKRVDYYLLISMTDRELRDLGIGRSEIRDRFYGKTVN